MGLIITTKVVARAKIPGRPYLVQPGNQEQITIIKYINTRGWSIPSTIIFKGKVYIKGWFDKAAIPLDQRIKLSTNRQTTNIISLCWLQKFFIPAINRCTRGGY